MIEETSEAITTAFKALRSRSGLSLAALAKSMGYRGASSLQRYEDAKAYRGGFLPDRLIRKLEVSLVGRGDPPIQSSDVIELGGSLYVRMRTGDTGANDLEAAIQHVRLLPNGLLTAEGFWKFPEGLESALENSPFDRESLISLSHTDGREIIFVDRQLTLIASPGEYAVVDHSSPGGIRIEDVDGASVSKRGGHVLRTDVLGKIIARLTLT